MVRALLQVLATSELETASPTHHRVSPEACQHSSILKLSSGFLNSICDAGVGGKREEEGDKNKYRDEYEPCVLVCMCRDGIIKATVRQVLIT